MLLLASLIIDGAFGHGHIDRAAVAHDVEDGADIDQPGAVGDHDERVARIMLHVEQRLALRQRDLARRIRIER